MTDRHVLLLTSSIFLLTEFGSASAADSCLTLADQFRLAKTRAEETSADNPPDYYQVSSKLMVPAFDTSHPFGAYIASRYAAFVRVLPDADHETYVRSVHRSACIQFLKSLAEDLKTPIEPPSGKALVEMVDRIEAILLKQAQQP